MYYRVVFKWKIYDLIDAPFPVWAGNKSAFSCLCFPDTNVIRYIQLTEMKIQRNAQREKKEAT